MRQPNILVMLADDLGYGDLGCYGAGDIRTPHLDRLATEGARFTQWYGGAPVCSASRASLLTGRYCQRVGVPGNVPADRSATGLSRDAPTLAERLRDAGYRCLMSGKWHLGQQPGERPHERGFHDWFGFLHGCIDYYSHVFYWLMAGSRHAPRHDLWHNATELFEEGRYATDLIADRAVSYLEQAAAGDQPFFLYVPFNAPHYPLHGPPELFEPYAELDEPRRLIAGMVSSLDAAVGRVVGRLDDLGLSDNTVVFFSSDHGPSREPRNWPDGRDEPFPGGSTGGLRGHKFELFEGGVRLPAIIRWPGGVEPGRVVDSPLTHMDLAPTLLAAAGGHPAAAGFDGVDLGPVLRGHAEPPDRDLCWAHGHQRAVRRGRWKLVLRDGQDPHLSDLDADPAESTNLADAQRDRVAALTAVIDDWAHRGHTARADGAG